jgi:hypothetical protein
MVAGFSHLWGAELLKVAILIDGSFFSKKFYHRNKKHPNPNDVKKLIDTALADPTLKDSILFRAYYYDCYPYNESAKHPITKQKFDYSDTNVFKARQNYLRKIALMPNIALRSGRLSFSGWKIPPRHFNESCTQTWSGREDLNLRPLEPHSSALPVCATPRRESRPLASSSTGVKEAKGKNDPPEPSGAFAAPGPEKG